jgi:phage terminase large subunit GpA-like protein
MRYGKCKKCGKWHWLEKHHIYPQSQFNDEESVIYLCPNCHTDLHVKMGQPTMKDKGFYQRFHISWIMGIIAIIILLSLI